jgi:cold shock CspA family protein
VRGVVVSFNRAAGFGHIRLSSGLKIYVAARDNRDAHLALVVGQPVEFAVEFGRRGIRALDVKRVRD